jgi:hypothetical protein
VTNASRSLIEATRIDRDHVFSYLLLAKIYIGQGLAADALSALDEAARIQPMHWQTHLMRLHALRRLGRLRAPEAKQSHELVCEHLRQACVTLKLMSSFKYVCVNGGTVVNFDVAAGAAASHDRRFDASTVRTAPTLTYGWVGEVRRGGLKEGGRPFLQVREEGDALAGASSHDSQGSSSSSSDAAHADADAALAMDVGASGKGFGAAAEQGALVERLRADRGPYGRHLHSQERREKLERDRCVGEASAPPDSASWT